MSKLRIALVQDSPDQIYYPGSFVRGNLLLDVNKPKSYKRITVQFVGKSHVSLTGGRRSSQSASKDKENSSTEEYVDLTNVVWNSTDHPNGKLTPGQHCWPFNFAIPQAVPPSYEGAYGRIRYVIEGNIEAGSSKSNHTVEARIAVQQLGFVYTDDSLRKSQHQVVTKRMGGCCTARSIVLRAVLPKATFFVGESFVLKISLENGISRPLEISIYVKQNVKFSAENGKIKWDEKTIATVANTEASPRATRDWEPTIEMPPVDILEESSCDNIKITHSLLVNCKISSSENLFTVFPLKINFQPEHIMPPPLPSNPHNTEFQPHIQPPVISPSNHILPSAPPTLPRTQQPYPPPNQPYPVQIDNPPFNPQDSTTLQYPQVTGYPQAGTEESSLPPGSSHSHISRQVSLGGVPTPFAGVPVAMNQWESTISLK